jgi:diaminopimelate epimerase
MRGPAWETFLDQPLDLGGGVVVRASAVSMGNPHLVLFVDEEPRRYHVSHIGAVLERDDRFPEGTNVEFARVVDGEVQARVWERGSGETLACGSGACAIAVTAQEAGLTGPRTVVRFPGGPLEVERTDDGSVLLAGDATRVFETTVALDTLLETRP